MNEKLMELLHTVRDAASQVGDCAADVAYGVGKKAEARLSALRQRAQIAELRQEVDDRLREAGEMIYATHTGSPTDSDTLLEKLREIDALYAELDRLEGGGKTGRVCGVCGVVNREGDDFCRECGARL